MMNPNKNPEQISSPELPSSAETSGTELLFGNEIQASVSEIAKTQAGEQGGSGTQSDDTAATTSSGSSASPLQEDRDILRHQLLSTAPSEGRMRQEIRQVLKEKQIHLENKVVASRKKRNYEEESRVLAELRQLYIELQTLAKISLAMLQNLWLKLVHHL